MFQYEVEIQRPVRDVYRQFADPDALPRWLTGLQKLETISGTPGEAGAVTRQTYLEPGRLVELVEAESA